MLLSIIFLAHAIAGETGAILAAWITGSQSPMGRSLQQSGYHRRCLQAKKLLKERQKELGGGGNDDKVANDEPMLPSHEEVSCGLQLLDRGYFCLIDVQPAHREVSLCPILADGN